MRRVFLVLAAAALVMGGSACSDDADPEAAPPDPPTPAVSTTPASGPVAPTLPPEAEGDDAAAAEAFVRFYWEMADYAQATGDVSGLGRLAAAECIQCTAGQEFVSDVYARGGEIRGGTTSPTNPKAVALNANDGAAFQVRMKLRTERQVVDLVGEKDDTIHPASTVSMQMVVERAGQRWVVAFWDAS